MIVLQNWFKEMLAIMHFQKIKVYALNFVLFISLLSISNILYCQNFSLQIEDSINSLEKSSTLDSSQKLIKFYELKGKLEKVGLIHDSIYAHVLLRIGSFEYKVNKNFHLALENSHAALKVNASSKNKFSKKIAIFTYYNIAVYYSNLLLFNKAILYFDSTINLALNSNYNVWALKAMLKNVYIYFRKGDYQKCAELSTIGMAAAYQIKDSISYLSILNQRAQALYLQNQTMLSLIDVDSAINLAKLIKKSFELASAYKIKGFIYASKSDFNLMKACFDETIKNRIISGNTGQIAIDYNDFGDFYADNVKDYAMAKTCYFKGLEYVKKHKDSVNIARLNCNLGNTFFQEGSFVQAQIYYSKAFDCLKLNVENFFLNPASFKINLIGDKELLINLFENKTQLLLNQFNQNSNPQFLNACIRTAFVTDSIINETRHEQFGEQSKLYWRNNTRDFYNNAIKASCLASDARLAFFFMEKSRAVLLNDKLNELGASAHLPISEAEKEDSLRENIVLLEQQLVDLKEETKVYAEQQMKLLKAKENWQKYTQSLERKYPAYYQYKYDDEVPGLASLQKYLAKTNQAFIHYFITDLVIYILGITPTSTKLIKVSKNEFNSSQLSTFLKMCADKQALNAHYDDYINLSNLIYSALFQPLQIKQRRVIVCADNFLIPFGALSVDKTGEHFLIQDHAFSYAYSACSLLKSFNTPAPKGDLLGIAPVDFASHLQLPSLKKSGESLKDASKAFNNVKLLRNNDATKYSFIKLLPYYSVVNVFSHASVDSAGEEPVLFMADSVIHLSELQNIKTPATNLVILSACQTNVGKLETGEGVYSLARGFASSGIQSVAATLWKADEDAIYEITKLFDQKLAQGMRKDDALQEAELAYMKHGNGKELPYFWANMVLVGNADPVKLSSPNHTVLIVSVAAIILLLTIFILLKRNKKKQV